MVNFQQRFQQEKYARKYIETDYGYICYNAYSDNSAYVYELYVIPEERRSGKGLGLESMLIEREKCNLIYCDVDLKSIDKESSLTSLLLNGYKIIESQRDKIILEKRIEYGRMD